MGGEITNYVFEVMPAFRRLCLSQRSDSTAALERANRSVSLRYRTGRWRVHHGFRSCACLTCELSNQFTGSLADSLCVSALRAVAIIISPGPPGTLLEVMMTPHLTSPMAIFRVCLRVVSNGGCCCSNYGSIIDAILLFGPTRPPASKVSCTGFFTVGVTDVSEPAVQLDHKLGHILSIVGIPSAFLLHGYVGFIFGSVKANPWWGQCSNADHFYYVGHGPPGSPCACSIIWC